jgi:Kef-type K+ transport system membrane component KefB
VSFSVLVLVGIVALLGPLLAWPTRWRIPVVLGELVGGILIGHSGFGLINSTDPTLTFLADLGFGLTMFVAGSKVPIRDARLRPALLIGLVRALGVGLAAAVVGVLLADIFHTGNAIIYAVLMASSSAALILPVVDELSLGGPKVLLMIAQAAIADTACIVVLPLVIDPANASTAAVGAVLIAVGALILYFALRWLDARGILRRAHKTSERRHFALELRVSLIILFSLATIATLTHVSIMLAGFACGLAVAAVGEPQRLAKQLFALNDGFLGPVFFVWLGASLSLDQLVGHPELIVLGLALGIGALLVHALMAVFRQPLSLGVMAAAQLGVPVAAATVGQQTHVLSPGEPAALILGALVTIAGLVAGSAIAARRGFTVPRESKSSKHPKSPKSAKPAPSANSGEAGEHGGEASDPVIDV